MLNLSFFKNTSSIILAVASLFMVISAGFVATDLTNANQVAFAAPVYACSHTETLSDKTCVTTRTSNPTFELKCATGYTVMDTTCVRLTPKACSEFPNGTTAANGNCEFKKVTIYGNEIANYDGRECKGTGYSFYSYQVGDDKSKHYIVCGSFSGLDYQESTWLPLNIVEIANMESIQTGTVLTACPAGSTEIANNQCSRAAIVKTCDAGGEYSVLVATTTPSVACTPCPAGSFCPATALGATSTTVCVSGDLVALDGVQTCNAPVKYTYTDYTTGCDTSAGYVVKDQSCAIIQNRDHDFGCSYFFAETTNFKKATTEANGQCSTGGSTDFKDGDIFKVSDLNCAGPGTAYYNYNVSYDPLVCGTIYNPRDKAAFRWYPQTFTKITGLQKLPIQKKACPSGWTDKVVTSAHCYQSPVTLTFTAPIACPINTYSVTSSSQCATCAAGTTSPVSSVSAAACVAIPCTNGAINPPACDTCAAGKVLYNHTCVAPCTNGATNPTGCNVCPINLVLKDGSCQTPVVVPPVASSSVSSSSVVLSSSYVATSVSSNTSSAKSSSSVSSVSSSSATPAGSGLGFITITNTNTTSSSSVASSVTAASTGVLAISIPKSVAPAPALNTVSATTTTLQTVRTGGVSYVVFLVSIVIFVLALVGYKTNKSKSNFSIKDFNGPLSSNL